MAERIVFVIDLDDELNTPSLKYGTIPTPTLSDAETHTDSAALSRLLSVRVARVADSCPSPMQPGDAQAVVQAGRDQVGAAEFRLREELDAARHGGGAARVCAARPHQLHLLASALQLQRRRILGNSGIGAGAPHTSSPLARFLVQTE